MAEGKKFIDITDDLRQFVEEQKEQDVVILVEEPEWSSEYHGLPPSSLGIEVVEVSPRLNVDRVGYTFLPKAEGLFDDALDVGLAAFGSGDLPRLGSQDLPSAPRSPTPRPSNPVFAKTEKDCTKPGCYGLAAKGRPFCFWHLMHPEK